MKLSLILLVSSFVLCTYSGLQAQTAAGASSSGSVKGPPESKPRKIDPQVRSNLLAKTGGLFLTKAEGPSLLFLNTQTRVSPVVLDSPAEQVGTVLRLPVKRKDSPSEDSIKSAVTALQDKTIGAVVVLGDSPGYPSLLIAPESRWAFVNVAALGGAGITDSMLEDRTQKEVWRAFGYLMGAAHSNFESCVMKPILVPRDLDDLKTKSLCPEPFNKIMVFAQKLGMKPSRVTTYRKAVEEGWAPAPTNDVQRAIWSELKKN